MSEFDDVDETDGEADEVDETGGEAVAWCAAGMFAFDAVAGLDFPDEFSVDEGGLDVGDGDVSPASQILFVPDEAADTVWTLSCEADDMPADAYVLPGELDVASSGAIDEALDSMALDELVEVREQLVVGKEVAENANLIDDVNPNFDPQC